MENILIVGAHPDDIELGCIGSLMKLKKEGKISCRIFFSKVCDSIKLPLPWNVFLILKQSKYE